MSPFRWLNLFALVGFSALAQNHAVSLDLRGPVSYMKGSNNSKGFYFGYSLAYHYRLAEQHQAGAAIHADQRDGTANFGFRLDYVYNFSADLARSYFAGAALGAGVTQQGEDDEAGVFGEVLFSGGRRFALTDSLVYQPSVYLQLRTDSTLDLGVQALSLGWFF